MRRRGTRPCAPSRPLPAPAGARVLEEGDVRAGAALLVGVEEVVDRRVVLVDGLLDEPQAEDARVEVDVPGGVARDARDVMDPLERRVPAGVGVSLVRSRVAVAHVCSFVPIYLQRQGDNCICNQHRVKELAPHELAAWRGLLRIHSALVHELDRELELDARPAADALRGASLPRGAPSRQLRMSELASSVLLSQSGSHDSSTGSSATGSSSRAVPGRPARAARVDHAGGQAPPRGGAADPSRRRAAAVPLAPRRRRARAARRGLGARPAGDHSLKAIAVCREPWGPPRQ